MNIGLAITRCSIGYKVWAIDGGPIAEGPLSGAGASFCIQGWKTCQAGSVAARTEIASKTAQVLDDHPVCVSHSSCLVYPTLIIVPEKCRVSIEIHRLV